MQMQIRFTTEITEITAKTFSEKSESALVDRGKFRLDSPHLSSWIFFILCFSVISVVESSFD